MEGTIRGRLNESLWEHLKGRLIPAPKKFVEDLRSHLRDKVREQSHRWRERV